MPTHRLTGPLVVFSLLTACGGGQEDPVSEACGSLPTEDESVTMERATSAGLFDGRFRCLRRNGYGSIVVRFYEDGSFESQWQETDEPRPGLEGWAIPREEGRFDFEDGRLVALGMSTNGYRQDPFLGDDAYEFRVKDEEVRFYAALDPMARTDGGDEISGSRFENAEFIWDFHEDRLDESRYDDEFDDWHDRQYEYRIDGQILLLGSFGTIGSELIPQYLLTLEGDCLKRSDAYGTEICTPID